MDGMALVISTQSLAHTGIAAEGQRQRKEDRQQERIERKSAQEHKQREIRAWQE